MEIDQDVVIPLLYNPLPANLPTVQKDILILAAAHHGDSNRYVRLRRPSLVEGEIDCLVRGIYHFPMFAKWCSLQDVPRLGNPRSKARIKAAINARLIMSNEIHHITAETPGNEIPYCIWHPQVATAATYTDLARRRPSMKLQAAQACIVADYQTAYQDLDPGHDPALWTETEISPNPFYLQDQQGKAPEGSPKSQWYSESWKLYTSKDARRPSSEVVLDRISRFDIEISQDWVYDCSNADFTQIESTTCASKETRVKRLEEEHAWSKRTSR
jgi:hypothetical protein